MQLESQHRTPLSPLFSQLKGVAARVAGLGEMGQAANWSGVLSGYLT